MKKYLKRSVMFFAATCLALTVMADTAFATEVYPAQSVFSPQVSIDNGELQVNALDFQGDPGETVFVTVNAGDRTIARYLPHVLGASGVGNDAEGELAGDVFVIKGNAETIDTYLADGLTVEVYSDRKGTVLKGATQVYGVHAVASDGGFDKFLLGTYTEGSQFNAPQTIVVNDTVYNLESYDEAEGVCAYKVADTAADTVNGKITYYDVKSGEKLDFETPINDIENGEIRSVDIPETLSVGGTLYRTLSYVNPVTVGYPGQTTYNIGCVEVTDDFRKALGQYQATIEMVDENGTLIARDSVFVAGSFAYAPPSVIYKTRSINGTSEVFAYENPTWEGKSGDETAIILDAATDGVTTGSRTITVVYEQTQGDIELDVTFNLLDGTKRIGSNLIDSYEAKASAENTEIVLEESRETVSKDGITYNLVGERQNYSYTYGSGETPVIDVYYVPEGYSSEDAEPYDITIRYVNYVTGELITTETATAQPNLQSTLKINTPAEFVEGGVTYIRLDGQDRPIEHNYFSNVREYTIYYRDSNDTLTANTVITNVRTVYRTGTTGAAATTGTTAATATTPTATATTSAATTSAATDTTTPAATATPAPATTNPATDYTVAEGDNSTSALTTPSGTDANQERIDDTANPLASGIDDGSTIDGNAPDGTDEQAKPGLPGWLIPFIVAVLVAAGGVIAFLLRKRNGEAMVEEAAEDEQAEQQSPSEQ